MITERLSRNTVALSPEDVSIWRRVAYRMPELLLLSFENDRRDAAAMFAWADSCWRKVPDNVSGLRQALGALMRDPS